MPSAEELGRAIGDRIRDVRRAKGLSLLEVEELSEGEFKASVLGAYERGERSISVTRLLRLADVYDVNPAELLPLGRVSEGPPLVVNLEAVEQLDQDRAEVLEGFLSAIQAMRQDPGSTALSVRRSDLEVLSALVGEQLATGEASPAE